MVPICPYVYSSFLCVCIYHIYQNKYNNIQVLTFIRDLATIKKKHS